MRKPEDDNLQSVGQSQLMMQCGMFVAASSSTAPVTAGVYTHFQRAFLPSSLSLFP